MDALKKKLEQREKPELIARIQHMLRQVIAGWLRDAISQTTTEESRELYEAFLAALGQVDRP